jgi:hypothetical protein
MPRMFNLRISQEIFLGYLEKEFSYLENIYRIYKLALLLLIRILILKFKLFILKIYEPIEKVDSL